MSNALGLSRPAAVCTESSSYVPPAAGPSSAAASAGLGTAAAVNAAASRGIHLTDADGNVILPIDQAGCLVRPHKQKPLDTGLKCAPRREGESMDAYQERYTRAFLRQKYEQTAVHDQHGAPAVSDHRTRGMVLIGTEMAVLTAAHVAGAHAFGPDAIAFGPANDETNLGITVLGYSYDTTSDLAKGLIRNATNGKQLAAMLLGIPAFALLAEGIASAAFGTSFISLCTPIAAGFAINYAVKYLSHLILGKNPWYGSDRSYEMERARMSPEEWSSFVRKRQNIASAAVLFTSILSGVVGKFTRAGDTLSILNVLLTAGALRKLGKTAIRLPDIRSEDAALIMIPLLRGQFTTPHGGGAVIEAHRVNDLEMIKMMRAVDGEGRVYFGHALLRLIFEYAAITPVDLAGAKRSAAGRNFGLTLAGAVGVGAVSAALGGVPDASWTGIGTQFLNVPGVVSLSAAGDQMLIRSREKGKLPGPRSEPKTSSRVAQGVLFTAAAAAGAGATVANSAINASNPATYGIVKLGILANLDGLGFHTLRATMKGWTDKFSLKKVAVMVTAGGVATAAGYVAAGVAGAAGGAGVAALLYFDVASFFWKGVRNVQAPKPGRHD